MPQIDLDIDESTDLLVEAEQVVEKRAKRLWRGFADFAIQDNVLEVAVGLILAAAFTTVVTSFVSQILLPPLSLLPFLNRNLDEKFAVLRRGPHYVKGIGYTTMQLAQDDGAVVLAYGSFMNKIINFLGVGFALYTIASVYEWVSSDSIIKHTIHCPYCKKLVSQKATRCVFCTSWLDGRDEPPPAVRAPAQTPAQAPARPQAPLIDHH